MYENLTHKELCEAFHTDEKNGLTEKEAQNRLLRDGSNTLKKAKEQTVWDRIQNQINDPMIFILFLAASISMLLREYSDTGIILLVIALNTTVGVIQEGKARKALEALKKMTAPSAVVKRDGIYQRIAADKLVKGDVVKLKAGNQVPADIRLLEVQELAANESALTGESLPVMKSCEVLKKGLPVAERKNTAYMSTEIRKGSGEGIVVATGMDTELGKIAGMIEDTKQEMTPLQKRLGDLGKILSIVAVALCAGLFFIGVIQHRNLLQMLLLAISLAVAAIPEGLPAVVTIVLALGAVSYTHLDVYKRQGHISSYKAFCNFIWVEIQLCCRDVFHNDFYMIFCIFHSNIYSCSGHCIFCNIYNQIFKHTISSLAVQRQDDFFFRKLPAENQICCINFILKLQFYLPHKADNINIHNV